MTGDTIKAVEAALLNSEGHPGDEVAEALYAVTLFAMLEFDATDDGMRARMNKAIERARAEADRR